MRTFVDNAGRTWELVLNVAQAKRVRDLAGIDLLAAGSMEKLSADPISLGDALYVLCRDQAQKAGVSDVQFGEGLAGDAIDRAVESLLEEYIDFFPQRRRALLRQAAERAKALEAAVTEAMQAALTAGQLDKTIQERLGGQSVAAPESSESTPAP